MSYTSEQLKAMIDLAESLYSSEKSNERDLAQSASLFEKVLLEYMRLYGRNSENVAWVHNWLGLVYAKMEDHFNEAETNYTIAADLYTSGSNLAIVLKNHSLLQDKKAKHNQKLADQACQRLSPAKPQAKSRFPFDLINRGKELSASRREAAELRRALELATTAAAARKLSEELSNLSQKVKSKSQPIETTAKVKQKDQADTDKGAPPAKVGSTYRSPADIVAELDKVVIGQRATKRGLANAAAQHLRRMQLSPEERANTDKANVLIIGPTGCGKTLLTQALAGIIDVPCYRTEATKLTASGYVGDDVHGILTGLLRVCEWDVERAQNGIIYLDEIDKVTSHDTGGQIDVRGRAVQEELLTILEGTKVAVSKDGKRGGEQVEIDTTNILFVVGGAFTGLAEMIQSRKSSGSSGIGFGARLKDKAEDTANLLRHATAEDFFKFGLIPEFVGRLPKRLAVRTLTIEELKRILVEPKKALLAQKRLLLKPHTDLRFTEGAVTAIAEEAHKTGTNGRALLEIVEQVLDPVVFDAPARALITAEMVYNRSKELAEHDSESEGPDLRAYDFIVSDSDSDSNSNSNSDSRSEKELSQATTGERSGKLPALLTRRP